MPALSEPPRRAARVPVLLLVDHLGPVGPGRQVRLLAGNLPLRFAVTVAAAAPTEGGPATEGGPTPGPAGVDLREAPLAGPLEPAPNLAAVAAVRHLLAATGAVIVHTHTPKAGALGRLAAVGVERRPVLVHTFHGPDLAGVALEANRHAALELERRLARRTDALVALVPETRDRLLELRIGRPEQYRVIPLGLELAACRQVAGDSGRLRSALALASDAPLAGMVGPLVEAEGHDVVLRALAELPGLHLAVLGTGPLGGVLGGLARGLGLADRVHLTGWWGDVPSALADLDVLVSARDDEATPAGLVEALAAGRPVVAADAPGPRAVVEDGLTGWLCRPGDPGSFATALRQVLARPVEAMTRTALGRRRVVDAFDVGRLATAHGELYDALLARPAAPVSAAGGQRRTSWSTATASPSTDPATTVFPAPCSWRMP